MLEKCHHARYFVTRATLPNWIVTVTLMTTLPGNLSVRSTVWQSTSVSNIWPFEQVLSLIWDLVQSWSVQSWPIANPHHLINQALINLGNIFFAIKWYSNGFLPRELSKISFTALSCHKTRTFSYNSMSSAPPTSAPSFSFDSVWRAPYRGLWFFLLFHSMHKWSNIHIIIFHPIAS